MAKTGPVNLDQMEKELSDVVSLHNRSPRIPAPALQTAPLPEYVEHAEGVNHIGKLTAEVIVRDYEETAKRINEIGEYLGKVAHRCEEFMGEIQQMVTNIDKVGVRYRERGAEIFKQLETSAQVTERVREMAGHMLGEIGATLEDDKPAA